jgi:hypothetical protein
MKMCRVLHTLRYTTEGPKETCRQFVSVQLILVAVSVESV